MAWPKHIITIPVAAGVDTRTDQIALNPPKWAALDNCVFDTPSSITKRPGFARINDANALLTYGGSTPARMVRTRGPALFVSDGNTILAAPVMASGSAAGAFLNARVDQITHSLWSGAGAFDFVYSESISAGDIQVCVYERTAASVGGINVLITYKGALLASTNSIETTARSPHLLLLGDQFIVLYADTASSNLRIMRFPSTIEQLTPFMVAGSGLNSALISSVVIADLNASLLYDADVMGTRALVTYNSTVSGATIKHAIIDAAGTVEATSTITAANTISCLACAVEPVTQSYGVTWGVPATTSAYAQMFTVAQASLFAAVVVDATAAATMKRITCAYSNTVNLDVFYDFTAAASYNYFVKSAKVNLSGTILALTTFQRHCALATKAWVDNGRTFVGLCHISPIQSTFFIARTAVAFTTGTISLAQQAENAVERLTCGALLSGSAGGLPGVDSNASAERSFLPRVSRVGATRSYLMVLPKKKIVGISGSALLPVAFRLTFDDPVQYVDASAAAIFAGCIPWQYDGFSFTEHGFLIFPEIGSGVTNAVGGSLTPSQTYSWRVYLEWTDSLGKVHLSTTALTISATTGVADNRAVLTINTVAQTNKRTDVTFSNGTIVFAIFRNLGTGTTSFFRVSNANPLIGPLNLQSTDAITFTDVMSDAQASTQPLDPISQNLSDNVALPNCRVLAQANGRLFASGFDDDDQIWYSQFQAVGSPIRFTDNNQIELPAGRGGVTAMAEWQDSLLVFRQGQIYQMGGDGLNATATSGGYTTPRLISNDIGCSDALSVVKTPVGVMFKSLKGIWMISGEGPTFIGADVLRYNAETVNAAIAMPMVNQVRFLTANRTMVYDYELQRWSVWSIGGLDATLWNNTMVILRDNTGRMVQETVGLFLDDGVPFTQGIETPWIRGTGAFQGKQRVTDILILGTWNAKHQPLVKIAYDYEQGYAEQYEWNPSAVIGTAAGAYGGQSFGSGVYGGTNAAGDPASGVYQFLVQVRRPKCQAIKLRIEDQALQGSGVLGASFTLTAIELLVGTLEEQHTTNLGITRGAGVA